MREFPLTGDQGGVAVCEVCADGCCRSSEGSGCGADWKNPVSGGCTRRGVQPGKL